MKRTAVCILFLSLYVVSGLADSYPRQPDVDVTHYEISISLNDGSNSISGTTRIDVRIRGESSSGMWLDLAGMQVDHLRIDGDEIPFTHSNGRLSFRFGREYGRGETVGIEVRYHGTANNTGIRIGENRYGRRVFFTDNWPDFASHWFPSIDHPSDKATVDFIITAPRQYTVVANGRRILTEFLPNGFKKTRWVENTAIPTYSMAFGAAEFSVTSGIEALGIPISWYVFPRDAAAAEQKFRRTDRMLRYFCERIGPYPFEKLAHVESNTQMAAMENANTIFYSETLFYPLPVSEDPVPHEIAHQWFGNSVTPADWDHLWLNEGFATYFDALFYAQTDAPVSLEKLMAKYADRIFAYPAARSRPVIDPRLTDLMKKLNPLNYEKGAWFLHMLRGLVGDEAFFEGIRHYYGLNTGKNVWTKDFRESMESAAGLDLSAFFRQWLHQPAWPEYRLEWDWNDKDRAVEIRILQMQQTGLFDMPLDLVLSFGSREETRRIRIKDGDSRFRIPAPSPPSSVEIDPDGWVLKTVSTAN
ncbi:MAG: M1 family metallopeptidase [Acidobacteria bacterium]|nr:M1 family metallopeptidase [Acidobacteriota bacterium]